MTTRFLALAALATALVVGSPPRAQAQEDFGPHRTLLMIGGYGTALMIDAGENQDRADLLGGGGRLMINLAPFSGPGNSLLDFMVIGGFVSFGSGDDVSVLHSGAELDLHFVHNPLGGFLDPFVLAGAGRFRTRVEGAGTGGLQAGEEANFALSPGAGVRIPLTGLFELRADGRDVIIFGSGLQGGGERTTHNPEFTAGLQLRF
jgi:hypothetical protein